MKKSILRISLLLPVILFTVYVFSREIAHLDVLREENERIKAKIERIEGDNDELRRRIKAVTTDKPYIEKMAREELGMIKQGEKIYRFTE
ncbi:MAG: FtsB family cell division protein [Deltaproteobacteria bacterium]